VLRRADADLCAKLVGISPKDRSEHVGEHAITLGPILRYPRPHRRERVRKPSDSRPRSSSLRASAPRASEKPSGVVL